MRKIFYAALAAGALLVACEKQPEPEPVDPVVPEVEVTFPDTLKNFEVKPGDTLAVSFTPAKDWTLSVPSDNLQWFWIADGSFKVDKLSGKASEEEVTVNIGVSETEEFDTNRSCDVTLAIGEESRVIAQFMRPAKERTLAVYTSYGTEEIEAITVEWCADTAQFRTTVRVESNCEWTVSYPEWLTVNVPENTIGIVELPLTGESLEEVSGKLGFKAGDTVLKEITVTMPSCKGMDIFTAEVEAGEFKYSDSGEYMWTEAPVEEVDLVWLGSDFRMPVKISSKCDWTVVLPQWLTAELPEKTAGEVTFTLLGVPSKYPLEDTSDKIVFKSGDTVIHEIKTSIPGCKDIMTYSLGMALTHLDFNAAGDVKTSTGYADVEVTASVFGTSKVEVSAFEMVGGKYVLDKSPEWIDITVSAFNTASDAAVLQDRDVKISVTENMAGDREAVLLFVPHTLAGNAKTVFAKDSTAVKEEYLQYAVPVIQLSNKFVITMNSTAEAMAEVGASCEVASDEKKSELVEAFGETDQIYVLTYDNIYARDEAWMSMARTFDSVKVFDINKADQSETENFWLVFNTEETMNGGVVDMYYNSDPEKLPELPTSPSTGYVVFYDADGSVLGIIECVSPWKEEEEVTPPEGGDEPGDGPGENPENPGENPENPGENPENPGDTPENPGDVPGDNPGDVPGDEPGDMPGDEPGENPENPGDNPGDTPENPGDTPGDDPGDVPGDEPGTDPGEDTGNGEITDEEGNVYVEITSYFTDPAAAASAGAKMYEYLEGPVFDFYAENNCPILKLVYTDPDAVVELSVPTTIFNFTVNPYEKEQMVTVDGKDMYNDAGYLWEWDDKKGKYVGPYDGTAEIAMHFTESDSAVLLFYKQSAGIPSLLIICELDLD